jgi:hypothetical protein
LPILSYSTLELPTADKAILNSWMYDMQLPYDMYVLPWSIASSLFFLAQAWQSLQQR